MYKPVTTMPSSGHVSVSNGARLCGAEMALLIMDVRPNVKVKGSQFEDVKVTDQGVSHGSNRPFVELLTTSGNDEEPATKVEFPEFVGWNVWSAMINNGQLCVALYRS